MEDPDYLGSEDDYEELAVIDMTIEMEEEIIEPVMIESDDMYESLTTFDFAEWVSSNLGDDELLNKIVEESNPLIISNMLEDKYSVPAVDTVDKFGQFGVRFSSPVKNPTFEVVSSVDEASNSDSTKGKRLLK